MPRQSYQTYRHLCGAIILSGFLFTSPLCAAKDQTTEILTSDQIIKVLEKREKGQVINLQPIENSTDYRARILKSNGRVTTLTVDQFGVTLKDKKKAKKNASSSR